MNIKSIKHSTINEDGSAVIELSSKELESISTYLSIAQDGGSIDNEVDFELYVNMFIVYNLVVGGEVKGANISNLQDIISSFKKDSSLRN